MFSTMHPDPMQGVIPCPLDISRNSQCMVENIFPHALSGDFFHACNINVSTKISNQLKFSTRVTSMVYCSMMALLLGLEKRGAASKKGEKHQNLYQNEDRFVLQFPDQLLFFFWESDLFEKGACQSLQPPIPLKSH